MSAQAERQAMQLALGAASHFRGKVEPNPLVGAAVIDIHGELIAVAAHERFGGPHAEVNVLDKAGDRSLGGTLVVTLEPCSHHGKTPPCVDRIIASGIRRVVAAMRDPFPEVAGKGFDKLIKAGIVVGVGVMEAEARVLNAPYLCLLEKKRPYMRAKWAMTADGKTAAADGSSKWITGEEAREHAHRIRGLMDAIIVGVGTVLADDPLLTARGEFARKALRVVVDSTARTPLHSRLVMTARDWPTMIVVGEDLAEVSTAPFASAGCEVLRLPKCPLGRIELPSLAAELGRRRFTNALVEGGAEVLGAFLSEGLIDAVDLYVASKLLGGRSALGPVGGDGLPNIASALELVPGEPTPLGNDLYWPMRAK